MDMSNWTSWQLESPAQFSNFEFEEIDMNFWTGFSARYCNSLPIILITFYYTAAYICYKYMEHRAPFDLRRWLFWWNGAIGTFSIIALCRMSPELFRILQQPNGFYISVCVREGLNKPVVFWIFAYAWSKAVHFGDTFFLLLRKKPVSFFHVFHHTIAVYVPMQIIHLGEPIGRWFTWLNYLVHAFVYPYFALKTLQLKVPKAAASLVVIIEMFQMLAGLGLGLYSLHVINSGGDCVRHSQSVRLINAVYTSFVLLVGKMTYDCFFSTKRPKNE